MRCSLFSSSLLILSLSLSLYSCKPESAQESDDIELQRLAEENERLKAESSRKDSSINSFLQGFNTIQENLEIIKEKEGILTLNARSSEEQSRNEDQIINDLQTINQLMAENREALTRLNSKLRQSNVQAGELRKMFDNMQQQVEVRNAKITELQGKLEQMNEAYKNLYTEYNARIEELDQQQSKINLAWYTLGNSKSLREQGILTREGGFIGLGGADRLRADFSVDYFTQVDISQLSEIPILTKKATIVTTHPEGSYKFEGTKDQVEKLVILDPAEFWRISKYLVVVTES